MVGEVGTVGIVGAGTMGAGIAQVALEIGHDVLLHDADPRIVERATDRIQDGLRRRATSRGLEAAAADDAVTAQLARLRPAGTLDDLATVADLVIEAAIEDLEVKRGLFRAFGTDAAESTVLATNTSALSVAAIGEGIPSPGRVVGLHFFNPAPLMPLVEVVAAPATDADVVDRMATLMTAWGKTPVRCVDAPGFIVNRVNRPFTLEALAIAFAGSATIVRVDRVIRDAGFPMGPFELMDLVGLDVNLAAARGIHDRVYASESGALIADRFRPSPIQERMVAAGHLGRKMGGGFYRYDPAGAATGPGREWDGPEDEVRAIADDEIVERIVLAIVNEAYRALGEGVATADDIDLAIRLGAGHPIGPFARVEGFGGPAGVLDGLRRFGAFGPRFEPAPALLEASRT